jgi:hypothetical protein
MGRLTSTEEGSGRVEREAVAGGRDCDRSAVHKRHTMTMYAYDTCGLEGGAAATHFELNSVSVDVVGIR